MRSPRCHDRRAFRSTLGLGLVLACAGALATERARADGVADWLGLRAEVLAARSLDPTTSPLFALGVGGALGAEVLPHPAFGVELGVASLAFVPDAADQVAWTVEPRLSGRLHLGPLVAWEHDPWVEVGASLVVSGALVRPGVVAGLGVAFRLDPLLRLGPLVRLRWSSDPVGGDPTWLELGLALGFGGAAELPTVDADADGDGVPDADDPCPDEAGTEGGAVPGCPADDLDGDGVHGEDDLCPEQAAGLRPDPARAGCPLPDRDGDGALDAEDTCPELPAGDTPDEGRPGCPLADRDGDSVPDDLDRCPDEPGAPSADPAQNGCRRLSYVREGEIHILRPVFFATGRDVILEESYPVLFDVADAIRAGHFGRVRIEGHTDDQGSDETNRVLSQRRAASVMAWLVEHGVGAEQLSAEGFGESRPLESNDTELGRAANRRVEFHILYER